MWQALPEPLASKNVWKFIFPKGEYADGLFTGGLRGGIRCSQVAECGNGRTKVCLRHPDLPQHIFQFHLSQCLLPWGTNRRLRGWSLLPSTPDIPKLLPLYLHHPRDRHQKGHHSSALPCVAVICRVVIVHHSWHCKVFKIWDCQGMTNVIWKIWIDVFTSLYKMLLKKINK